MKQQQWDYEETFIARHSLRTTLKEWGKNGWRLIQATPNGENVHCLFEKDLINDR